ncbi:MAG: hypothetical protein ACM3Q4_07290 [Acidobacteriota bacterium]
MKISTFRPMNLYDVPARQQSAAPAQQEAAEVKAGASATQASAGKELITKEEKQFFAKLYPDDTQKITSYSTYTKNGVAKEHSIGSLIDKKS